MLLPCLRKPKLPAPFAGGWEKLHTETVVTAIGDDTTYDVFAIVSLHVAIVLPVVVTSFFTLASAVYFWCMTQKALAIEKQEIEDSRRKGKRHVPRSASEARSGRAWAEVS